MKRYGDGRRQARHGWTLFASICFLAALIFVLPGCSRLRQAARQLPPWSTVNARQPAGDREVARLVSSVRPARGNPDSHYRLARYYQERHRHREALEELEKAVVIDPGFAKAYNAMGVSYDFLADYTQAVLSYRRALEVNGNDDSVLNNLGYSLYLQGDHAMAIDSFRKAIALSPDTRKYHSNLGRAYFARGDHEGALAEFRLSFGEAGAQYFLAHSFFKKGQYPKAQYHYALALAENPSFLGAKKGLKAARRMADIHASSSQASEDEKAVGAPPWSPPRFQPAAAVSTGRSGVADLAGSRELKEEAGPEDFVVARCHVEEKGGESITTLVFSRKGSLQRKLEIEIANGSGEGELLAGVTTYLKRKGYGSVCETTGEQAECSVTRIFYREDYLQPAYQVAKEMPGYQEMTKVDRLDRPDVKVKVMIGRDMLRYRRTFTDG